MLGGAEDAGLLGGAFDAVEGGDQIEDGGDFWVGEQIEDLASDVSPANQGRIESGSKKPSDMAGQ